MATFTQHQRLLVLTTPLGPDVLLVTGFSGQEQISRLFHFQLDLLSEKDDIAPADIVGMPITWTVDHVHSAPRYFNGFVSRFAAAGKGARGLRVYRAEVVPWLWFLTRTTNCKIFQNQSADKIIQAVFDQYGFSDYKVSLSGTHSVREYCVQYRETAFDFVSRLMEQEGIFYFFKHEDGKHTLILADAKSAYGDCPENKVAYAAGSLTANHISSWYHQYEFRSGKWTQTDYNFKTPRTGLLTSTDTVVKLPKIGSYEKFDYPGLYLKTADGTPLTKVRIEEEETGYDVVTGASTCCTFTPAGKFELIRHECGTEKKTYVLTTVQHSATDPGYEMKGGTAAYHNTFSCIPADVVFRPDRVTPRPFVHGPQTAVVVGPPGAEVFCDKYGRVKVQFHWDREGQKNADSSCWIRVGTVSAGKRWGMVHVPRIGQEIIADFLEGDPDQPIIIGSVHNAEQMPSYLGEGNDPKHPHDPRLSGVKSNSTPGGNGYNELRFDDTAGKEQVFLHAEKDLDVRVKHDSRELILHDHHLIVGKDDVGNQHELIHKDRHVEVRGNHTEHGHGNRELLTGGNEEAVVKKTRKERVEGDDHRHVKGAHTEKTDGIHSATFVSDKKEMVTANSHVHVTKDRKEQVDGSLSLVVGKDRHEKVGQLYAVEAGKEVHAKAGKQIVLEAGTQLTLKGPGGFITIGPDGISIEGLVVRINAGGTMATGSGCQPADPALPAEVEEAAEARPTAPVVADDSRSGQKSAPD